MIIFKCEKCGAFLGEIKNSFNMRFKAKKGISIEEGKLVLSCKCGEKLEINIENYIKKDSL